MNKRQFVFISYGAEGERGNMADGDKRRDRHDIVAEILKTAVNGRIKTHIMYRAKLSYSQVNEYLPMLVNKGFLENHKAARGRQTTAIYRTTTLGLQLIENLESINKLWEKNFLRTTTEE
jgi:predicted transcriptional regulator